MSLCYGGARVASHAELSENQDFEEKYILRSYALKFTLIPNPAIEKSRFVREGRQTLVV